MALRSFLSSASIVLKVGDPPSFVDLQSTQSHAPYPQTLLLHRTKSLRDHEWSRVLAAAGLLVGVNWGASRLQALVCSSGRAKVPGLRGC
jgi:hypothetical protein